MIVVCFLTLLLIFDIPKIAPLPVSPRFVFLWLALMLVLQHRKLLVKSLSEFPVPLFVYFLMVFVLGAYNAQLRNLIAPIEAIVYFAAVVSLMMSNQGKAIAFTRYITLLFFASVVWFLASLFIEQPFMAIRQLVYAAHVGKYFGSEMDILKPTGLTFNHFNMGYQVSIGMVMAFFLWAAEKGAWKKVWAAVTLIMAIGVIYVAQRSTIPAFSLTLGLSLVLGRKWRQLLVLGVTSVLAFSVMSGVLGRGSATDTLQSRTLTIQDTRDRLGWQLAALKVIAQNPAGNIFGNLDWETESIEEGADYSYYGWSTKAVHNAYLGRMLSYGWVGVLLVLSVLILVYRNILRPGLFGYEQSRYKPYAEISAYAFIAVSIQALFHNASIFTVEPSSWVIFSVAAGWAAVLKREKFQEKVKSNA